MHSKISIRKKRRKSTKFRFFKFIHYLLLCPILIPTNCRGRKLTLNKSLEDSLYQDAILKQDRKSQKSNVEAIAYEMASTENGIITVRFATAWTIITILSTFLISFILEYLNNTSPVKECLLLYLCQDVAKTFLLLVWILYVAMLACLTSSDRIYLGTIAAKLFSFGWIVLSLFLLLMLNFIGAIKLYTTRKLLLDPPMPWDQDERSISKKVRFACMLLSLAFVSALFGTGGYPKIYYNLTGDNRTFSQLSIMTSINSITIIFFLITYVIMLIATKVYNTKADKLLRPILFSEKSQSWSLMAACLLGIGIVAGFVFNMFGEGNMWIALFLFQLNTTIVSPTIIIYFTPDLRTYIKCTIKKNVETIGDFINSNCSRFSGVICTKRSPQIHPTIELNT